jgi:23S rRNA pseudouridine2605 synthase
MVLNLNHVRLAKYLALAGVASRRASEAIVRAGRVRVGGEVVTDPARAVQRGEPVAVDGRPLAPPRELVVYALNKPAGVLSTARDTHGRPTVTDLVRHQGLRLYPVGRLDAETTGLILLTNDGALAHRLTHPSFGVEKIYRARVASAPVRRRALRALREGVRLEDGLAAAARVRALAPDVLELTLREGRKHQVRRMCEAVGHRVISLERVRFGPLELGALGPGVARRLSEEEIEALRRAAAGRPRGAGGAGAGAGRPGGDGGAGADAPGRSKALTSAARAGRPRAASSAAAPARRRSR